MSRTIVVGLDGSPESLAAAAWAADEALRRGAALRLVHVDEPELRPPSWPVPGGDRRAVLDGVLTERAADLTARHPGLRVTLERLTGVPGEELAELSGGTDLIVLGSRGLGRISGFVTGSVAGATVARAGCPVALVRAAGAEGTGTVLLGLALPEPADALITFAFEEAERRGAELLAVHAWNVPSVAELAPGGGYLPGSQGPGVDAGVLAAVGADSERRASAVLAPWRAKYPEVAVRERVTRGRAARLLLEEAPDAALVVTGRRMRTTRLGAHIGPVTHALIHHCPAPLVVVPHE
ncbi:universal stress protein [Streptomyces radicis]|uniref:Universal stress protein n=1 Tax=Streptomyces radicis TaxID=1750517 RepID=A0A3A9VPL7_9ACTN|nr:universal stress protein [Streptomyces radicis]RKN02975.1 universal stress protein [Streptomyces radicis]RKN12969.1 universal stress protein [Streptomyces radicis]